VGGLGLERRHLRAQRVGNAVAPPEEAGAHALLREIRELAVYRLVHQLQDRLHLVGRPRPVLGREGVDRERADALVDRGLDGAAEGARPLAMPLGDGQPAGGRPAPAAVHDDRHAPGDARIVART
jgi:hypothetical protein